MCSSQARIFAHNRSTRALRLTWALGSQDYPFRDVQRSRLKNFELKLGKEHLISFDQAKLAISNTRILFLCHWAMFDKLLIANDDYINRVRSGEINPHQHIFNENPLNQEQADLISESFGKQFRKEVELSKQNWEIHFEKSQNYLRVTHLAQSYLFWEEKVRRELLELINFSHPDILVEKCDATLRANIFGDLGKIRNSLWHSRSGSFGECNFKKSQFRELTEFIQLEKGETIEIGPDELPKIGLHVSKRLFEFPVGYTLGEDTSKNRIKRLCV